MSLCQNKLITITGAKAGIQKFISSTICIVSLSSATVCVCVCVPVPLLYVCLAPLAAGTQTSTPTCYSVMVSLPLVWLN